jgi:hypothetical protein
MEENFMGRLSVNGAKNSNELNGLSMIVGSAKATGMQWIGVEKGEMGGAKPSRAELYQLCQSRVREGRWEVNKR